MLPLDFHSKTLSINVSALSVHYANPVRRTLKTIKKSKQQEVRKEIQIYIFFSVKIAKYKTVNCQILVAIPI